jgi:hypothetical protein
MEQFFDVLGPVVILVFIAIGKLLEVAFKGKGENNTPPRRRPAPGSRQPESESGHEDLSEVQERIRRLIMERAGIEEDKPTRSTPPPPAPEPEPLYFEEPEPVVQDYTPAPPPKPPAPPPKPRIPPPSLSSAIQSRRRTSALRRKLGLNNKENLKKAILQREILGPPLALRKEDQRDTW